MPIKYTVDAPPPDAAVATTQQRFTGKRRRIVKPRVTYRGRCCACETDTIPGTSAFVTMDS